MTEITQADRAMQIACLIIRDYGDGDEREQELARTCAIPKDHPAYQAAKAGLEEGKLIGAKAMQNAAIAKVIEASTSRQTGEFISESVRAIDPAQIAEESG
jgi:hypothetical protein